MRGTVRRSRAHNVLVWTLVCTMTALGLFVTSLAIQTVRISGKVSSAGSGGLAGIGVSKSELQHRLDSGHRVNILMLGYGGPNHDGPYLTDSIMVASLDPVSHETAYISIPRDLEVSVRGFTDPSQSVLVKINTAFAIPMSGSQWGSVRSTYVTPDPRDGAMRLAADVVTGVTGLHIDYTVAIDFAAFRTVVDDLGGIDVTVPQAYTTDYPDGETTGWKTLHFAAGPQHMDGTKALAYVRSRYPGCSETGLYTYDGGRQMCDGFPITQADTLQATDFARAQRQQQFIETFLARARSLNAVVHAGDLINALSDNVRTSLAVPADLLTLWGDVGGLRRAGLLHVGITDSNFLYSCECDYNGYTLHLNGDGAALRRYLGALFQPAAVAERVPITVRDGTGDGGHLSAAWAEALNMQGLNATDGGPVAAVSTTIIEAGGGHQAATLAYLRATFHAVSSTGAGTTGGIVLTLGGDALAAMSGSNSTATGGNPTPAPSPEPGPSPSAGIPSPRPTATPTPRPTPTHRPGPSPSPRLPSPLPSIPA